MGRYTLRPRPAQSCASPHLSPSIQSDEGSASSWGNSQADLSTSSSTSLLMTEKIVVVKRKIRRPRKRQFVAMSSAASTPSPLCVENTASSSFITEDNKLSIDLQAMNIDHTSIIVANKPKELKTVLYPLDLGSGMSIVISYTYPVTPVEVEAVKALDMPLLTSTGSNFPSPSHSSAQSQSSAYCSSPDYPSSNTSWSSDLLYPYKTISGTQTSLTSRQERTSANVVAKCIQCMRRKRQQYRYIAPHSAVAESIIKDARILELISLGLPPRFRIVPKPTFCVSNYRKAHTKICVTNIACASYPNTEWSVEVDGGVMRAKEVLPEVDGAVRKIQVLSNILIQPQMRRKTANVEKTGARGDCKKKTNPTFDESHKDIKRTAMSLAPTLEINNNEVNTPAISENPTQGFKRKTKKRRKTPPQNVVDIYCSDDDEYEMIIERLGPDYKPVLHDSLPRMPLSSEVLNGVCSPTEEEDSQSEKVWTPKETAPNLNTSTGCSDTNSELGIKTLFDSQNILADESFETSFGKPEHRSKRISRTKAMEQKLLKAFSDIKPVFVLVEKLSQASINYYTLGCHVSRTIPQFDGDDGDIYSDDVDETDNSSSSSMKFTHGRLNASSELFSDPDTHPIPSTSLKRERETLLYSNCEVPLKRIPHKILQNLLPRGYTSPKNALKISSQESISSLSSYKTFKHSLERYSTPLEEEPSRSRFNHFDAMWNCQVHVRRMSEHKLMVYLKKAENEAKRFIVRGGTTRYNLRRIKKITQVDGADDSSSDEDDECIVTRSTGKRCGRRATRGRTVLAKADDLRYPTLDITVTQSPNRFRRTASQVPIPRSPIRPPGSKRRHLDIVSSITMNLASDAISRDTRDVNPEVASRKLNFDLGATLVEEKVECRYRPETGSAQTENTMSLSQLKQQILAKTGDKLPMFKEKLPEVQLPETDSFIISTDKFSIKDGTRGSQVHVADKSNLKDTPSVFDEKEDDVHSNHSDELFSSPPLREDHCCLQPETKNEVTLTSSLEALITPYQENQPEDDAEPYNSQSSIFDIDTAPLKKGGLLNICAKDKIEELSSSDSPLFVKSPVQSKQLELQLELPLSQTRILSKAAEYDIANKMLVKPGPSNCPSSFESAIMFASSGEYRTPPEEEEEEEGNQTLVEVEDTTVMNVSVLDLTSCLEINDVDKMDTLSLELRSGIYSYITPKYKPPSCALILETMASYNIPEHRNQDPFYSDARHVSGAVDVGHNTLRILAGHHCEEFRSSFGTLMDYQREIAGVTSQKELRRLKLSYCSSKSVLMQPVRKPPSITEVKLWLLKRKYGLKAKKEELVLVLEEETCREVQDHETSEMLGLTIVEDMGGDLASPRLNKSSWDNSHAISGVSLNNTHGFKMTLENLQEARSLDIYQYITSLVMELHAESRGDKLPDPQTDPVKVIFFALANDIPDRSPPTSGNSNANITIPPTPGEDQPEHFLKGFICVSSHSSTGDGADILTGTGIQRTKYVHTVPDEMSLYQKFLELYHLWNPDILMGYEIEQASWGYLVERGYVLGLNIPALLSRIKAENEQPKQHNNTPEDQEDHTHLKITGRIVLDLWRILKHEIALQSYTFENLAYHVLHVRVPHYSARELSLWWNHKNAKYRHRTVEYFLYRVEGAFKLIDHYDLVGRTSELARLFGILFYEVLSRGSQFRVESMMLRLAKPYRYVPVSPSVQQRAHMKAPEFLPLILEPESKFYKDPVIVLDFQSLYPSIIIAYNYCFSTCLGRVEHLATDALFEFGAYELEVSRKLIAKYLRANLLTISPCGVAFVKEAVRPGVLPRMLREILDTRLMVKQSMKKHKGNKTLQKVLHSRQLGLKLIANVTYGYTAANFSGRMPACEMADSVVSKGRETLQRAINLVEKHSSWGARVVYGDTDSMFVLCAGKSREEAFRIGAEIAEAVTEANPSPVRLKLEKVYQPCILQTKKRYVGYMFESKEQKVPEFEAKGIETVRRDGCPAASKMLEKCLKLLFDHRDVSQVRNYVLKQFNKILTGRVSIQDLTFAKEYRGREGYRPGACVPALELSRKWMLTDKRKEPRSGERVPYVIINGPPGLPLIKLVKSPHDLLEDNSLRPNALYYITKAIIPPINRCFKLIGADLFNWFNEMPRKQVQYLHVGSPGKGPKSTISQYFATAACASCGAQTKDGICPRCLSHPATTLATLHQKIYIWERNYFTCQKICASCCARSTDLVCNSLDCPVLYRSKQTLHDLQQTDVVRSLLDLFPEGSKELF